MGDIVCKHTEVEHAPPHARSCPLFVATLPAPTRVTTVRLPAEMMDDVELVARVDGVSVSEFIRTAIAHYLAARGIDEAFKRRVRERVEADHRILQRLAAPAEPIAGDERGGA